MSVLTVTRVHASQPTAIIRITPLGQWLRETKINELPQLWNVLVGEMSIVGPRPEDPEIAESWPWDARREILSVRPGITSPTSVLYRDEEKMLKGDDVLDDYLQIVMPDKLRLDQLYVRNHRFLSDLDIIFWTLLVLLPQASQTHHSDRVTYITACLTASSAATLIGL